MFGNNLENNSRNNNMFNLDGMYPIVLNTEELGNTNSKLYHDSYEVYVNRDYVGRKTLLVQGERVKDVEDHLKNNGFHNFSASVEGNNIIINSAEDEAVDIKRNLDVYLNIR